MSAEQWTLSRIVGRNGQPRTGWHLNMPDEWPEHSLVEAVCVVPVAERDALAARVEELEARIARAVEVVGMAPSYSTRGRAISILLGEGTETN